MQATEPDLIRQTRAIDEFDLCRSTFDKAVKEGVLRRYKFGRATFLDRREIVAMITGNNQST